MTERWVADNLYCPVCGRSHVTRFTANRPVADFYCENCKAEYELKSREAAHCGRLVPDGAYHTMIERINATNNPNLLIMTHVGELITNVVLIPHFFFTPHIIVKRKPLASTARRAGWQGCSINYGAIPSHGKIFIVREGKVIDEACTLHRYAQASKLNTTDMQKRSWLMDTLRCIDAMPLDTFTLTELYQFEAELQAQHPENHYIREKIRQQLQLLRDKGLVRFEARGVYRKVR